MEILDIRLLSNIAKSALVVGKCRYFLFHGGKTNPKKISTRLLHPWIRNCFHKDSTQSERHKKDLDDCEVSIGPDLF